MSTKQNTSPLYGMIFLNEQRSQMELKNPSNDKFEIERKLEVCWNMLSYKNQQKYKENLLPLHGYVVYCLKNQKRILAENPTKDYNYININLDDGWLKLTKEQKNEYDNENVLTEKHMASRWLELTNK